VATTGEKFPTAAQTINESPWLDEAWVNPNNALTNDGTNAAVTAATYDTGDQTAVLKLYTYDMSSIPVGATIDGVIVRIHARGDSTSVRIDLCQLLDTSRAKVGTNKASTVVPMTASLATYTFGANNDLWGNSLTRAWVQDADFGVAIGCHANTNNSEAHVNYATIEVFYTVPPKVTGTDEVELASHPGEPAARTQHSMWVRARKTNGAHTGVMRLRLYEGTTARSTEKSTSNLTTSLADYELPITDAEAASITDYTDLRIRFNGYASTGDATVFEVDQFWLRAPDVYTPPTVDYEDSGTVTLDIQVSSYDLYQGNPAVRGSYFYNGNTAYETTPFGSTIDRPFTVGVWIKPYWLPTDTVQAPASLGRNGAGAEGALPLLSSPTTGAAYEEYNSDFETVNAGSAITADAWNSLAAVFTSHSSRKAYANGNTSGSTGTGAMGTPIPDHNRIYLGKFPDGSWDFRGWIAYLFVWEYALSDAEITAWHNGDVIRDTARGHSYWWDLTLQPPDVNEIEDIWNASVMVSIATTPIFDTGNTPPRIYEVPTFDSGTVYFDITPSGTEFKETGGAGTEYTDSNTVPLVITPVGVEVRDRADATTVPVTLTPSAIELREFTDANTVYVDLQLSAVELREFTDANTVYVDLQVSSTEIREFTDAATVLLDIQLSSTDLAEFADTGTVYVDLQNSATELRESADATTVALVLTPSATEFITRETLDSGTVSVVLTPSAVEVRDRVDAATVSIALTPSAVEIREFTDANTIYVDLQTSSTELRESADANTIYVDLQVSDIQVFEAVDSATVYFDIQPAGVDEHVPSGGVEYLDSGTVLVDLQLSSTEVRDSADNNTVAVALTPSSVELREIMLMWCLARLKSVK
jgi:hypothetical protein